MTTSNPLASLDTLLSDRNYDRQVVLIVLLSLFFLNHATAYVFQRISTRFIQLQPYRQTQVAATVPMLVLRVSIGLLVAYHEYSPHYSPIDGTKKSIETLHQQFNLFYILCLGYLFELLYRPSPFELDVHHIFCMMGAGYHWFRTSRMGSPELENNVLDMWQIPLIIIMYGIPPVDFASDNIRILYHCVEPSFFTIGLFKTLIAVAWGGRILQWSIMAEFILRRGKDLYAAWGGVECGIVAAFGVFYIWMEYMELDHFKRLTAKYRGRMRGVVKL